METVSKMILSDFQRGRLPYFVPPPKQESDDTTENKDKEPIKFVPATNKEATSSEVNDKKVIAGVKQDLRGLRVETEFLEDDQVDGM